MAVETEVIRSFTVEQQVESEGGSGFVFDNQVIYVC